MTNPDLAVQWFALTLIFMSILFSIILVTSLYAYYQLCQSNNYVMTKKIQPLFRNLTILSITAFYLTSITDIIHVYIHMIEKRSFSSAIEPKIAGVADTFYYIGSISFYSLLLCRVYFVFKDTNYQLTLTTLIILCIQIIISALGAIWHTLVIAFFYHNWEQWVQRGMPATYLLSCNDFVLNISLFILFSYKLRQTIANIEILHPRGTVHDVSSRMFTVIAKHSVLYSLAIITNQLFFFGVMLMAFTDLGHEHFTNGLIIIMILRAIENIFNVFALWLVLKHNDNIYYKCCGVCHKCIEGACRMTTKTIELSNRSNRLYDHLLEIDESVLVLNQS